jgi:hypothetical protein
MLNGGESAIRARFSGIKRRCSTDCGGATERDEHELVKSRNSGNFQRSSGMTLMEWSLIIGHHRIGWGSRLHLL